jgi:hypothetical protein
VIPRAELVPPEQEGLFWVIAPSAWRSPARRLDDADPDEGRRLPEDGTGLQVIYVNVSG